jgi:hypothetical protein
VPSFKAPQPIVDNGCDMKRRRRSTGWGWIVGVGLSATLASGTAAAVAPAIAHTDSSRTLMACLNERTDNSNMFRTAPRNCAVHFANKPFDGNDIAPLAAIHWSGWGRSVARGRGTFHRGVRSDLARAATCCICLVTQRRS